MKLRRLRCGKQAAGLKPFPSFLLMSHVLTAQTAGICSIGFMSISLKAD